MQELENNQNIEQNQNYNTCKDIDQELISLNKQSIDCTENDDNEGCEFITSTEISELKKTIEPCTFRRISMEEL